MEYKGKLYAKVNGKYIECTETIQQLESRIKELENNTTEVENKHYYSGLMDMSTKQIVECCKIEITNENFCPNCGRKIVR